MEHKLKYLSSKCREYLGLALSAVDSAAESRKQLALKLQQEKELLPRLQNEIQIIVRDMKKQLQDDYSKVFQQQHPYLMAGIIQEFKKESPQWKDNLAKTSESFRQWVQYHITSMLQEVSEEKGIELSDKYLNTAVSSLNRAVGAFQTRLVKEVESALNTKFSGVVFDARVEKPKQPDVQIGNIFMTQLWEMFWFIVPMGIFRPVVYRHFESVIKWEIEKNLYRLGSQWTEITSLSIDSIAQQSFKFIRNELITIENISANTPDKRKKIEKAIIEVSSQY